jgi:hypothetical protein
MFSYDSYGDFETFMHDVGCERIMRIEPYRRMFTPYEQERKFSDESELCNIECVVIKEVVNLENGDYLLGVCTADVDMGEIYEDTIKYYKLSEIRLSYCEQDEERYKETQEFFNNEE